MLHLVAVSGKKEVYYQKLTLVEGEGERMALREHERTGVLQQEKNLRTCVVNFARHNFVENTNTSASLFVEKHNKGIVHNETPEPNDSSLNNGLAN